MAKAKSKATRPRKRKPQRAVPLRSATASVRKKNGDGGRSEAVDLRAMAGLGSVSRIVNAYLEFPARLLRCQTPFDVWREQSLFAARVVGLTLGQATDQSRSRKAQR
jgi:hypothetical protein